jgi:hypothetical protein
MISNRSQPSLLIPRPHEATVNIHARWRRCAMYNDVVYIAHKLKRKRPGLGTVTVGRCLGYALRLTWACCNVRKGTKDFLQTQIRGTTEALCMYTVFNSSAWCIVHTLPECRAEHGGRAWLAGSLMFIVPELRAWWAGRAGGEAGVHSS